MDKQEFLLLIPAIIFGVAVVDLLKVFSHKKPYFEMLGWALFLMGAIIALWIDLYDRLEQITNNNLLFILLIGQAMLYAQSATVLTPEERDVDTKKYFLEHYRLFFTLITTTIIFNFLLNQFVYVNTDRQFLRLFGAAIVGILIFINKRWLRVSIMSLLLVLMFLILIQGVEFQ